jgi:excisionase family DNA binding protein
MLSVEEVVARMKASLQTVRRWLHNGRLRRVGPGGTKLGWRIREADRERFIVSLANVPETKEVHAQ